MTKKPSKITLKDIAYQLNLSITTVSRVLSGRAREFRISKSTEERVLSTAKKSNFSPNKIASALRTRKTKTIGIIVPDISNPFFATIAQNIEFEARKADYAIILCDSSDSTSTEINCIDVLQNRDVDGLIISPVGKQKEHIKRLYDQNTPLVMVDRYFPNLKIPYVGTDNYKGAFEAVNYLIECGHQKIACIQGLTYSSTCRERLKGYKAALEAKDIPVDEALIKGDNFDIKNGYLSTKLLLKQTSIPTAIFAQSNLIALGVLSAIKEEGYKIPQDISMIAFDEQTYSEFLSTPLSTIKQRIEEIGQISVRLLLDQMEKGCSKNSESVLLPPIIIHRNSVRIL